ncbi:hypothetical protein O9K51_04129 [Purpureocillium lavendulum]|uniref:Uncharacterized protein n=1 Tax=Purpureocillium lavendulum TaxID=1247861 RepID=A0AB34FY40_9HYPO|nr:hypothetical protein O9K51_04129 [Purpureocillium lavendulum]
MSQLPSRTLANSRRGQAPSRTNYTAAQINDGLSKAIDEFRKWEPYSSQDMRRRIQKIWQDLRKWHHHHHVRNGQGLDGFPVWLSVPEWQLILFFDGFTQPTLKALKEFIQKFPCLSFPELRVKLERSRSDHQKASVDFDNEETGRDRAEPVTGRPGLPTFNGPPQDCIGGHGALQIQSESRMLRNRPMIDLTKDESDAVADAGDAALPVAAITQEPQELPDAAAHGGRQERSRALHDALSSLVEGDEMWMVHVRRGARRERDEFMKFERGRM